jgi:hypothetical protein
MRPGRGSDPSRWLFDLAVARSPRCSKARPIKKIRLPQVVFPRPERHTCEWVGARPFSAQTDEASRSRDRQGISMPKVSIQRAAMRSNNCRQHAAFAASTGTGGPIGELGAGHRLVDAIGRPSIDVFLDRQSQGLSTADTGHDHR